MKSKTHGIKRRKAGKSRLWDDKEEVLRLNYKVITWCKSHPKCNIPPWWM